MHHCNFRSHGGLDVPSNLVVIGWEPWHDCHLQFAHGAEANTWRHYLLLAAEQPGTTAMALRRQDATLKAPSLEVTIQLFWDKVDRGGPDDCWEWQAYCAPSGHGQFTAKAVRPSPMRASVFSFWLANGRWPMPACLHHCDNAPCVNPAHLYEGDQAQNMRDRRERNPRYGDRNPAAKYADKIEEIRKRAADGEAQADIARSLGISSATISRIVTFTTYPRVDENGHPI